VRRWSTRPAQLPQARVSRSRRRTSRALARRRRTKWMQAEADRCGTSSSQRNATCAHEAHIGVASSVPASVPKLGPRTVKRHPDMTPARTSQPCVPGGCGDRRSGDRLRLDRLNLRPSSADGLLPSRRAPGAAAIHVGSRAWRWLGRGASVDWRHARCVTSPAFGSVMVVPSISSFISAPWTSPKVHPSRVACPVAGSDARHRRLSGSGTPTDHAAAWTSAE
jgi:hypothetical protein